MKYVLLGSAFALFVLGVVYFARGSVAGVWPYIVLSGVAYAAVFALAVRIIGQLRQKPGHG